MAITGDALRDFERRDREQSEWLDKRPICSECGEPIQDELLYHFDGTFICEDCMYENHREYTENYMDY